MANELETPLGYLSSGQQQRVFIARTLAQKPEVLLLDEPTTGIDAHTQHSIIALIQHLHRELGLTILMVTHDINLISPHVNRLAILNQRLFAVGTPREVLTQETLSQVYGKEIIIMERPAGSFVIVGDHHHA
jgi:ABC-type Mn2+/Zn2+ transport system ATPase subunit